MCLAPDNWDFDVWSKLPHWPSFRLIFYSFKCALALHRSQQPHWLCLWMPQSARAFGWHPSPSHRTASTDWPKYIVLSCGGTFSLRKWFMHHDQLIAKWNGLFVNLNWNHAHVCCISLWSIQTEIFQSFKGASGAIFTSQSTQLIICMGLQRLIINIRDSGNLTSCWDLLIVAAEAVKSHSPVSTPFWNKPPLPLPSLTTLFWNQISLPIGIRALPVSLPPPSCILSCLTMEDGATVRASEHISFWAKKAHERVRFLK